MTWDDLIHAVRATPDEQGWLRVTWRRGQIARRYVIQRVVIDGWELALLQTTIARETQLGAAEAVARLVPFPLGALVFKDGFWVLRQTLPLEGLTVERLELTLRCLDVQARSLVPQRPDVEAHGLFEHYSD